MDPLRDETTQTTTANAGAEGATRSSEAGLAEELRELGKQIQAVLFTVRTDPRAKEVEQQVSSAMREAEKQVTDALNTLRKEMETGRVKDTLKGTATTAADQVESGLARGLHGLNQRIAKFVHDAEETRKKREAAVSQAATSGTADNEVAERFGGNQPVFGEGLHVPATPVGATTPPAPQAASPRADGTAETLVTERFDDQPIEFGENQPK